MDDPALNNSLPCNNISHLHSALRIKKATNEPAETQTASYTNSISKTTD